MVDYLSLKINISNTKDITLIDKELEEKEDNKNCTLNY